MDTKGYVVSQAIAFENPKRIAVKTLLYAWAVPLLFLCWAAFQDGIEVSHLLTDPTHVIWMPFYGGAASTAGVMLWFVTAAVTGFASMELEGEHRKALLSACVLSFVLGLDDQLMLKETVIPELMLGLAGRGEQVFHLSAFLFFGGALFVWAYRFRELLRDSCWWILVLSVVLLSASALLEVSLEWDLFSRWSRLRRDQDYFALVMGGLKVMGIVTWAFYFWRLSRRWVAGEVGSGVLKSLVLAWTGPLLFLVWVYNQEGVYPRHLFVDLVATMNMPFYIGIGSTFGVILWFASGTVALFAAGITGKVGRKVLLFPGLMSLVLGLDDQLMLHERVLPHTLAGLPDEQTHYFQTALYLIYIGLFLAWAGLNRGVLLTKKSWLLVPSALLFGASIGLDVAYEWKLLPEGGFLRADPNLFELVEDGFKLLGIATWTAFCWRLSRRLVKESASFESLT
jgi:hypothetical protein